MQCGREGHAPDVRGASSAAVSLGNYRQAADVDIVICEECAGKAMAEALRTLVSLLPAKEGGRR